MTHRSPTAHYKTSTNKKNTGYQFVVLLLLLARITSNYSVLLLQQSKWWQCCYYQCSHASKFPFVFSVELEHPFARHWWRRCGNSCRIQSQPLSRILKASRPGLRVQVLMSCLGFRVEGLGFRVRVKVLMRDLIHILQSHLR